MKPILQLSAPVPHWAVLCLALCMASPPAEAAKHSKKKPVRARIHQVAPPGPGYGQRLDVRQAADEIAQARGLDVSWVRKILAEARYIPSIAKAVLPPPVGVPKNWALYRSRFIEPRRIQAGVAFWRAHRDALARAQAETGVPAEIIVGILGVETLYGQHMGNFRVLDALATLAFDFPANHPRAAARSAFFRDELANYLSLVQRDGLDPAELRGSYAGAMGLPQFMPSSWMRYAVDFDGDGHIDLFGSAADAIGSVAHYFQSYGWQTGLPTHYPVHFDPGRLDLPALLAPDIVPSFDLATFEAKGALLDAEARRTPGKLALIELQNGDEPPSYVAGTDNFYVITRYNWSSYYAMAVIELGTAVKQALAPA